MATPAFRSNASAALAHFFIGLMKADGNLSSAELKKIDALLHRFDQSLPAPADDVIADLNVLNGAEDFKGWHAGNHLDQAFVHFDLFVESGGARPGHLDTISDLVEILMEVDTVLPGEEMFLRQMKARFNEKYRLSTT